ncbi:uncharacterized protein [Argopecten irradians]|uniref:uncharacterized protein isoform X2 n=1 Tax=Argopecten irradians TaxID=31199 RepID=UPI00371A9614
MLLLVVFFIVVNGNEFPRDCERGQNSIDCRAVHMHNVHLVKDRIFSGIQRLYFREVSQFQLTCNQFPDVAYLRIEQTVLLCTNFHLCDKINIMLNGKACDQDDVTTPTSIETTTTLPTVSPNTVTSSETTTTLPINTAIGYLMINGGSLFTSSHLL